MLNTNSRRMASEPLIVQALFVFKGSNNDELCFNKGDLITVTQKEDGGWWEGTLGEKTGWFPSNYVREVKDIKVIPPMNHDAANISIVYQDLVESERAHVAEQQGLVNNFLTPLERSTILTNDEYKQLIGNFMEVLDTHKELLKLIEDDYQKLHKDQRIGRHFINHAQKMKNVHQAYCSLHPKAVCILDKYREELSKYMESCGANTPGVLVLTTGLSKPFRRLAKYSGMLLEVERHVESSHPDRGDIQRSVAVYKDIDATCAATRRQKELETQVLTGPVRGWEGQSLSTLGDILHMGSVAVGPQHLDRYLVLFPSTLLILSISHRLSAFIYEGKLPVTGITVTRLEDNEQYKNGFEITGPMIEKVTAVCQSKDEANHWVEILRKYNPNCTIPSNNHKALPSQVEIVPQPPPHMSALVATTPNNNRSGGTISNVRTVTPPSHGTLNNNRGWTVCCLRPSAPIRPGAALAAAQNGSPVRTNRKPVYSKDDALILEVIEAYFSSVKTRSTVNSVNQIDGIKTQPDQEAHKPQEHENVNELVRSLLNTVRNIECNMGLLTTQLTEERAARCTLQTIIKKHLSSTTCKDPDSIDWPTMESNILS